MQSQIGVLFEVEKSNVYIDPSVDLYWTGIILEKFRAEFSLHAGDYSQRTISASQTLGSIVSDFREQGRLSTFRKHHAIAEAADRLFLLASVMNLELVSDFR